MRRVALALLFLPHAAAAAVPGGAVAFLLALYRPYVAGDEKTADARRADAIFAPALLRLADRPHPDSVMGPMDDGDVLCDCQEWVRLSGLSIAAARRGPARAAATVRFVNEDRRRELTMSLERTGAGWRIADLGSEGMPSLRARLEGQPVGDDAPTGFPGRRVWPRRSRRAATATIGWRSRATLSATAGSPDACVAGGSNDCGPMAPKRWRPFGS